MYQGSQDHNQSLPTRGLLPIPDHYDNRHSAMPPTRQATKFSAPVFPARTYSTPIPENRTALPAHFLPTLEPVLRYTTPWRIAQLVLGRYSMGTGRTQQCASICPAGFYRTGTQPLQRSNPLRRMSGRQVSRRCGDGCYATRLPGGLHSLWLGNIFNKHGQVTALQRYLPARLLSNGPRYGRSASRLTR